jgi:hypothetical protein
MYWGIPKTRDKLIRRLVKERIRRAPRQVQKNTLAVDTMDALTLESMPEAAIAWMVEQFVLLIGKGLPPHQAAHRISVYRNHGLGIGLPTTFQKSERSTKDFRQALVCLVALRLESEFTNAQGIELRFITWAVDKCLFFFHERGTQQVPLKPQSRNEMRESVQPDSRVGLEPNEIADKLVAAAFAVQRLQGARMSEERQLLLATLSTQVIVEKIDGMSAIALFRSHGFLPPESAA